MPKPVCVPCHRFFRPKKNGYALTEGMPISNRAPPGLQDPDSWKPYKVWRADLWQCEGCGAEIVVGFGYDPIAVQHETNFAEIARRTGADQYQINDC